jgi:hypothetical protein
MYAVELLLQDDYLLSLSRGLIFLVPNTGTDHLFFGPGFEDGVFPASLKLRLGIPHTLPFISVVVADVDSHPNGDATGGQRES